MRMRIHDELKPEDEIYTVIDAHLDGDTYILKFLFTLGDCIRVGVARVSVRYNYKIFSLFENGYTQFLPNEIYLEKFI